jgi:hypothetical protein
MDDAFGGGAHGVEPEQRAGRHQDARAFLLGPRDEVAVLQELRDRQRHKYPALVDRRHRHFAEQRRRQAFHDDVAVVGERGHRAERDQVAELRQRLARLVGVAHSDCGEGEALDVAVDQAPGHFEADGA